MAKKTYLIWIIAVVVTLVAAIYQHQTGPSYAINGKVQLAGETIAYKLERTHGGETDMPVSIEVPSDSLSGVIEWKRHNVDEPFQQVQMTLSEGQLLGYLPHQPPAGKLDYMVKLSSGSEAVVISDKGRAIVTRFKGAVPMSVLLPHVLIMFIGMMLSTRTGLEAIYNRDNLKRLTIWSFGLLFIGGMILGPIVQYLAFGYLWSGVPLGWDMTDNKTLLIIIAWAWALWAVLKKKNVRGPALIASVVTLAVYLIPHSVMGSELDYNAEGYLQ